MQSYALKRHVVNEADVIDIGVFAEKY